MIQILVYIDSETFMHRGSRARLGCALRAGAFVRRGMTALPIPALHLPLLIGVCVRAKQHWQLLFETRACFAQSHAVLRSLGASHAWFYRAQVERQCCGILCLRRIRRVEQALLLVICL